MSAEYHISLPPYFQLGRFRVESVLGEGRFGITYKAWDTVLRQVRAIKEYLPGQFAVRSEASIVRAKSSDHHADFAWGIKQFLLEAQTLARFDHPSIVRVLELFEQNGTAYMVMPYYAGESLRQRIREGRAARSEEEILCFVRPLLQGLAAVHAENVLHLDIKPANIFIREDTQAPVLLDFGAAKEILSKHARSTSGIYTPGYAAIEQYHEAGRRGPWTDIYGLGATLYHMVVGVAPEGAPGRVEKDVLVPAVEAADGRYSRRFLAGIDAALRVSGRERPQSCEEWEGLLTDGGTAATVFVGSTTVAGARATPASEDDSSLGAGREADPGLSQARRQTEETAGGAVAPDRHPRIAASGRAGSSASRGGRDLPQRQWRAAAVTVVAAGLGVVGLWVYWQYDLSRAAASRSAEEAIARASALREEAITWQGRVVSMRGHIEQTRGEIKEQVVRLEEKIERKRAALRSTKAASERKRIEGEILELSVRSKWSASLRDISERELFTAPRLSEADGKIELAQSLIREQVWHKAADTFSQAQTLLERIDTELELVRQALDAQVRARVAQAAWQRLKVKGATSAEGATAKASVARGEAALASGSWQTASEAFAQAATLYGGLPDQRGAATGEGSKKKGAPARAELGAAADARAAAEAPTAAKTPAAAGVPRPVASIPAQAATEPLQ